MSEIVIGYDGSDSSKAALNQAFDFAKALGDSIVIVFGYAPGGYGGGEVPEQRKAVEEFGEKVTAGGRRGAKAAKVESKVEMVNEHPHEALITVAKQARCADDRRRQPRESPLKGAISAPPRTSSCSSPRRPCWSSGP